MKKDCHIVKKREKKDGEIEYDGYLGVQTVLGLILALMGILTSSQYAVVGAICFLVSSLFVKVMGRVVEGESYDVYYIKETGTEIDRKKVKQ